MKISVMTAQINKLLADELYPYSYLSQFIDATIDDINDRLSTNYPTVSEFVAEQQALEESVEDPDYNLFPEKYVRTVVLMGAAYKFFITDEEGIDTAQRYGASYLEALFKMQRDYTDIAMQSEYFVDTLAAVDTTYEYINNPSIDHVVQGWGW